MKDWPLVHPQDDGIRPAGEPDECYYCNQKVGQPHKRDCIIVKKKVRLRLTIEIDVDEPHFATNFQIEESYEQHEELTYRGDEIACGHVVHCKVINVDDTPKREIVEIPVITGYN